MLVRLYASNRLSVDTARGVVASDDASVEQFGRYWQIRTNGGLEIVLGAESTGQPADDVQLRVEDPVLKLEELESIFGRWTSVSESKTSSVVFQVAGQTTNPSLVFVTLFSSRPLPDSTVLSVQLRRDHADAEWIAR